MSKELSELHTLLVTSYVKMMSTGAVEDPRILKEIRELLKDNDITGDISEMLDTMKETAVEIPDDWDVVNG